MGDINLHNGQIRLAEPGRTGRRRGITRLARAVVAGGLVALSLVAGDARSAAPSAPITIGLIVNAVDQPAYEVLIPNFERAYPSITVQATYAANGPLTQLEATELAAGSAPALLDTSPGCGEPNAICTYAAAGELAPLLKEPWLKRAIPSVTSSLKHGQALFGFEPSLTPFGVFTNDTLFAHLGLKVPTTFAQLLTLCQKAQADGTTAVVMSGGTAQSPSFLAYALATANLYGQNRNWNAELKSGAATFDGTAGWREAMQDIVAMNSAGCFEPGIASESGSAAATLFIDGGGLMDATSSVSEGTFQTTPPAFSYSFYPFPSGTSAAGTNTVINVNDSLSVNAHASAASQAAAQTFIDFLARPAQDALFAKLSGGVTQYQFVKDELPSFMSTFAALVGEGAYVLKPSLSWWNANVSLVLQNDVIGLFTGQTTPDSVLRAMDGAWQQGPS